MDTKASKNHKEPQTGPTVSITVDNKEVVVHRGNRTVAEIKEAAGVSPEYVIDQIVGGEIRPLMNDDSITIKGDEVFISHPDDGRAS